MIIFPLLIATVGISISLALIRIVYKFKASSPEIAEVGKKIEIGADAFLLRQFKTIALVIPFLFAILLWLFGWKVAVASLVGVITSMLSGFIGMKVATKANSRTADVAKKGISEAFLSAVSGGAVVGLLITCLGLLAIIVLYSIFRSIEPLIGFGFGASLAALFGQIGGGIFTKSADIGADLVGKIEKNIPEDDPRNAAVIADLVGDNVGDCAGRGSDLFQTFSSDIVTGMIVASLYIDKYGIKILFFPLILQAVGIFSSIFGILCLRLFQKKYHPEKVFNIGLITTTIVNLVASFVLVKFFIGDTSIWLAIALGIFVTIFSSFLTKYYAGKDGKPVRKMAEASKRGAALNIITGLAYGMQSPVLSILIIMAAILASYKFSGNSFLAIIALNIGTDLMIAYIMTADVFGPITDNAAGIAEMSSSPKEIVDSLSSLDTVGNTMKAITKAYAMTSGTVSAFVIFTTFFSMVKIDFINVSFPFELAFLFIGATLPFLFSSLVINSTAKTALLVVDEVRRQFREIKGLIERTAKPDYGRCVDIATKGALKEMIVPGLIGILPPLIVGYIFGIRALGPLLIGAVLVSVLLGPFFNNSGSAFDNTKKLVAEEGDRKGSFQHIAAVVGDTVGDALKDVAGPSLLIFMKLLGIVTLIIVPFLLK
ncbi:MAG: sodium-translocating pyrophosphatase [Candidatus Nealsonbacteria bacterium CG08_land_8_20_14_0_20_43_11]|uniref:K(+)-insensitive pyrophosphate-energized proton pump n=1 Tax=Candidatus Nealsonbacteria bacterium CG08_land_8_20_14_0_20_43_11 TaxID=1974706 RepID=A0A2M6T0R4_9BACT|nr:MAG: sodium-translocating pyrophosphatase [Candidatus Nealsonbacteria bacterium CG08_land_8_20_14_0_20_43_11]